MNFVVKYGADEGVQVKVIREEDGLVWCERIDGEPFESGAGILTEFGFERDRLRPADPNALYKGMHIVVLGQTKSGKKNTNKKARPGMKGEIIKHNEKRSMVRFENGVECLVGNNLLTLDTEYVPPKPIEVRTGDLIVIKGDEKNVLAKVEGVSHSKCLIELTSGELRRVNRFDVVRVVSLKEVYGKLRVYNNMNYIKKCENQIEELKEMKAHIFANHDLRTAHMMSGEINTAIESYQKAIKNTVKVMYSFDGVHKYTKKELKEKGIRTLYFVSLKEKKSKSQKKGYFDFDNVDYTNNVFNKPDQIKKLKGINLDDIVRASKRPTSSTNYIGVEIECMMNEDREEFNDSLVKAGLSKHCKLVSDASIHREEDDPEYRIEVTVIAKQSEYKSILKRVLNTINKAGGKVNKSCGLHVHFDMRNRDPEQSYYKFYNMQSILRKLTPESRRSNQYCKPSESSFRQQVKESRKYSAINVETLGRHNTIEIRMHHGTLDEDVMFNWIDTLICILDNKSVTYKTESYHSMIYQLQLNSRLSKYVEKTVRKYA